MYKELLEVVKNNKVVFHFFTFEFNITTEVIDYYINDDYISLYVNDGNITIKKDCKVEKCYCPSNLIIECEHCFSITNNHDKHVGYIYCKKEDKKEYQGGNLRHAVFEKIKTNNDKIDETKLLKVSKHIGVDSIELKGFLKGCYPHIGTKALENLCLYLDIDKSKIHSGYFKS